MDEQNNANSASELIDQIKETAQRFVRKYPVEFKESHPDKDYDINWKSQNRFLKLCDALEGFCQDENISDDMFKTSGNGWDVSDVYVEMKDDMDHSLTKTEGINTIMPSEILGKAVDRLEKNVPEMVRMHYLKVEHEYPSRLEKTSENVEEVFKTLGEDPRFLHNPEVQADVKTSPSLDA
jgi:hypothetical protein